ncbi:uncharacterized protein LOC119386645 [Rhipicephalus sanguineus]|uniref:uncharacterized protein LOC119386645 n=1 Tax=Rhipicephalus sanguineus TaxID=34632 RepID=UPI001892E7FB|nr:uncharacterized protein LOC119386645 [Rhipicephalus sanguineus]
MELVREFGDFRVLVLAEDHIVLKLDTSWPRGVELPKGMSLGQDDGHLLVGNQESMVSAVESALPRKVRISKAMFCGCASFDSSDRYADAAIKLLRDVQEICIVHNRDKVYKLVRMFPNVKVLALLHDLCKHHLEVDEPCRDRSAPLVEGSQLRKLVGSVSNLFDGHLLKLSHETTLTLFRTCPDLCRIDSPWLTKCLMGPHSLSIPEARLKAKHITHLWLNSWKGASTDIRPIPVTAADMALAAETFPAVETLQVGVSSVEALAKVSAFRNLRSLTLANVAGLVVYEDMDLVLRQLLGMSPDLEELALEHWDGLMLSTISKLCPKIKVLKLVFCTGSTKEVALNTRLFPNLEYVEISMQMLQNTFWSFLSVTRETLRTARFAECGTCIEFLHYCVKYAEWLPFSRLEHLALCTRRTLRELDLEPRELHSVLKVLPMLRHLETDSYDLRLYFENYCVPRGRLSLSWTGCVCCAVHNPELAKKYS